MNQAPTSFGMADDLIKSHPELFKDDYETLLCIAGAMVKYKNACNEFINLTTYDPMEDIKKEFNKAGVTTLFGITL